MLNLNIFKKKFETIEILSFHGLNSSINSNLEIKIKSIIENILKNKNLKFNYSQNLLFGHAPNQTQMSSNTTFQKLINKSILDLNQFNDKKSKKKVLVATSTGAYLVLNWLHQNPKNNIDIVILFKPLIDLKYSINFFVKANPQLASQIKLDEFELSNKYIYGSEKIPFKINSKISILLFCGKQDNVVGNKKLLEKKIFGNLEIFESQNSKHYFESKIEYVELENFIKKELENLV